MDINQIIQAIKDNPQITYEDMKLQATNAGMSVELFEEAWATAKRPKYNPLLMALTNLLIPGFAYIAMRKYAHFLVAYIPLLIIAFFGIQSMLGLVVIIMAVDTYIQAKKINDGTGLFAKKRSGLNFLCGFMILIFFGLAAVAGSGVKDYLASSESSCKFLYPAETQSKLNCEQKFKDKEINAQINKIASKAITDPVCENFRNDETLKTERQTQNTYLFSALCYFRKAVETKNIGYCYESGFPINECVAYLAIELRKPELCEENFAHDFLKKECMKSYENAKVTIQTIHTCENAMPEFKERCEKEFGDFLQSINGSSGPKLPKL